MSHAENGQAQKSVPTPRPLAWFIGIFAFAYIALAVPFAAITLWQSYDNWLALQNESQALARGYRDQIDNELRSMVQLLSLLARSKTLERKDYASFYEEAKGLPELRGKDMVVVLRDQDGQQLINTFHPWGTPLPRVQGPNQVHVLKTKRPYISDLVGPENAPVLRQHLFAIVLPLMKDGEVRQTLSLGVLPKHIRVVLKRRDPKPGWIGVVGDTNGLVIARTSDTDKQESLGTPLPKDFMATVRNSSGEGVWSGNNINGVPIFTHFERSTLTGWVISYGLTQERLWEPLRKSLTLVGGMVGAVLLFSAWCWWWVIRIFTQDTSALSRQAAAYGREESTGAVAARVRELRDVSEALDHAARQREVVATERQKWHEAIELEYQHRSKNLLAKAVTALRLARRHIREQDRGAENDSASILAYEAKVLEYIDVLRRSTDSMGSKRFHDIVSTELACVAESTHATFSGPEVQLKDNLAEGLRFVLHELATNASKHGALSSRDGVVHVSWESERGELHLAWVETGGPAPPAERLPGLGTSTIGLFIRQLRGSIAIEYPASGLRADLRFPHTNDPPPT